MSHWVWAVWGVMVGVPLGGWLQRRILWHDTARERRTGWRYGYGAGWVDGKHGRTPDHSPPPDGKDRTGIS